MHAGRYLDFLGSLFEATGDEVVVKAAEKFGAMCESGFFRPLCVPDSMKQNAVIDWKGFFKNVGTANGTSAPDVAPGVANNVVNARCSRDTGEETRNSKWSVPNFAKFRNTSSMPLDKLLANGKRNAPKVMMMGAPHCTMPMRCGYTVTNPMNYQGTDVGYAAGGGGAGGGAATGG